VFVLSELYTVILLYAVNAYVVHKNAHACYVSIFTIIKLVIISILLKLIVGTGNSLSI